MDDWTNPVCFDNCPDEVGHASHGNKKSFNCEEMTDLVDREPYGGQAAEPEQEETDKIFGIRARIFRHRIGYIGVFGPYGLNHESYTLSCNASRRQYTNLQRWKGGNGAGMIPSTTLGDLGPMGDEK